MKKKRHRVIDPAKARAAAGGGGGSFYDRIDPAKATRTACSKCETGAALLELAGECLKCRLALRKEATKSC